MGDFVWEKVREGEQRGRGTAAVGEEAGEALYPQNLAGGLAM